MAYSDHFPSSALDRHRSTSPSAERMSHETDSSVSTTSLVFERIEERLAAKEAKDARDDFDDRDPLRDDPLADDLETGPFLGNRTSGLGTDKEDDFASKYMDRRSKRILFIVSGLLVAAWVAGFFVYIATKSYKSGSQFEHDPQATVSRGNGKQVTLDQVQTGMWYPRRHSITWIAGPDGEDGLLMVKDGFGKDFLVVEDVRTQNSNAASAPGALGSKSLIKSRTFEYAQKTYVPDRVFPSKDLQKVLVATDLKSNWRHSYSAVYWIFDVKTQSAEPLVPGEPDARIQLAQWSPTSDAIAFTRGNNMFLRNIASDKIAQITTDGGSEVFNGVPDWVYEEEVFSGSSATWFSDDGNYIAFLRTNETGVPEYPIEYFVSRPSGTKPTVGEEAYPEVRPIKYPKAGAHNPIVDLKFYDVVLGEVFSVDVTGRFEDEDRLITDVVWAGHRVIVKETNRVSDIMRVVLVDVSARMGSAVRTVNVKAIDGGWFEISHNTKYIPADASRGRAEDGYIDTVIHDDGDHLAYFTPLDNPQPIMLTSGNWEVVDAPSAVDLDRNIVYFVATKQSSIQRHVYQVKLTGGDIVPVSDTSAEGYYGVSFSTGTGYALLTYQGPGIPWQKVLSTPGNPNQFEEVIEKNDQLAENARKYELPIKIYGTINVDGVELNYVERRPPHFDEKKTYPVLFQQYSGPGSQQVDKRFSVDFQSYIAAGLGYVCVTVDGRGTGYIGRKNRVITRGNLGHWESHDQIAAAKIWAAKKYVDASKLAIWGWSYGGFMTLKTLEQDAGRTFSYGMAVAPVTDWRFYDSIYTERYMLTPQTNEAGYSSSAVSNVTALASNVRFLLMHGVADDNVHMQNSLTLLDKLNLAGVENYDVHVFPDSDHGIRFHNANKIVYDSKFLASYMQKTACTNNMTELNNWLINAFNGEWLKIAGAKPIGHFEKSQHPNPIVEEA